MNLNLVATLTLYPIPIPNGSSVYRGVSGGVLPSKFWEDKGDGVRGGVELGFMSTTTDRDVALGYMAQGGKAARMLFEVRAGK